MRRDLGYQEFVMSDCDFRRFRELIYTQCGINLVPAKKTMLTSRLRKRLQALGMSSFCQYFDYVSRGQGKAGELYHMLDAVSTNKTEFFREPRHFDYLMENVLPFMVRSGHWRPGRRLNLWSAGCSSGEEPYTIAMVLAEFASRSWSGNFSIFATDISTKMLEIARKGIYTENAVESIPFVLRRSYIMRGKASKKGFCRIVPELRSRVEFQRINLNERSDFGIKTLFNIIFCRNVIIYFDRQTQAKLFNKFYSKLIPGGYLFIGHSETLHSVNEHFERVMTSVYRKPG